MPITLNFGLNIKKYIYKRRVYGRTLRTESPKLRLALPCLVLLFRVVACGTCGELGKIALRMPPTVGTISTYHSEVTLALDTLDTCKSFACL